jgi:hypothetical protein
VTRRTIPIITHLSETDPPDFETLRVALGEIVLAVYGPMSRLELGRGSIGENPSENMLHFLSPLTKAVKDTIEHVLETRFGTHIVVAHGGNDGEPSALADADADRQLRLLIE